MAPYVQVDKHDALVDEVIAVVVRGLEKRQSITIRAETTEKRQSFAACGCFVADDDGVVDLTASPSLSGTYSGVSAMGLFWSMKSSPGQPDGLRLMKSNSSFPLISVVNVYEGHIDFDQTYTTDNTILCTHHVRRWYMAKDVQKKPVRCGRVRGMLFLPPGKGPFPGVIDMFGSVGALVEFRAALLASRGFATLALPYFMFDGLPKNMADVELEYFLEAIDWFSGHPCVISNNIGVLGVSKGGEIALHVAYYSPKVKVVVSINGAPFFSGVPMLYRGVYIGASRTVLNNLVETGEGAETFSVIQCDKENFVPIWEKDVKCLLICGGNDRCVNPTHLKTLYECYPEDKKQNCQLVVYPGAGHLIEPPYAPLARSTTKHNKGVNGRRHSGSNPFKHISSDKKQHEISVVSSTPRKHTHHTETETETYTYKLSSRIINEIQRMLWGGVPEQHAIAQKDSWRTIIKMFRENLPKAEHDTQLHGSKL